MESAIVLARDVSVDGDVTRIREALEQLKAASQKVAEALYSQQQAGADNAPGVEEAETEVVDGEFAEVDD